MSKPISISKATLWQGDCLKILKSIEDCSIDSIVTDPPYGLSFMGKRWDYDVPSVEIWSECLRVLKPGGHLLSFAGTRTQHRMAVRIEDAGFEIRDMIAWVYGSGFPKSHNLKKDWQGWGTALKPALEPITVARKSLIGTVAENVLTHGTGALNIDGCRVGDDANWSYPNGRGGNGWHGRESLAANLKEPMASTAGRWPANLIHDGSEEVLAGFPVTGPARGGKHSGRSGTREQVGEYGYERVEISRPIDDGGSAARFFYCAKASKRDRDEGLDGLDLFGPGRTCYDPQYHEGGGKLPPRTGNFHPTVKPTELMRYLCRLVTPPGGVILDPFMGSGSTGKAALLEGFSFIGVEREEEYVKISEARIRAVTAQAQMGLL